jgi:hypothetical protein
MPPFIALANLGGTTQMGSYLCHAAQGGQDRYGWHSFVAKSMMFLQKKLS